VAGRKTTGLWWRSFRLTVTLYSTWSYGSFGQHAYSFVIFSLAIRNICHSERGFKTTIWKTTDVRTTAFGFSKRAARVPRVQRPSDWSRCCCTPTNRLSTPRPACRTANKSCRPDSVSCTVRAVSTKPSLCCWLSSACVRQPRRWRQCWNDITENTGRSTQTPPRVTTQRDYLL